jgi:hypothetical protein
VQGAVVFDRGGGVRAAFFLQTAINALPLLLALLVIPLWKVAGKQSSSAAVQISSRQGDQLCSESSVFNNTLMSTAVIRNDVCSSRTDTCQPDQRSLPNAALQGTTAAVLLPIEPNQCTLTQEHQQDLTPCSSTDSIAMPTAAVHLQAAASVCIEFSSDDDDSSQQKGSRNIWHMDSARDMEDVCRTATAAVKQGNTDIKTFTLASVNSWPSNAISNNHQQQQDAANKNQQQQDSSSLDIRSVLSTVADPVVFSQRLLAFLEQLVAGLLVVLLPAVMRVPTWLIGVVYIAMVSLKRSASVAYSYALQVVGDRMLT